MNEQTAVVSRPAQGQQVATRTDNPLVQFKEQLETRAREIEAALPSHISAEKFQRTVITAVQQNPDLLTASRTSLVLACMKAAQDGLLPDGREAALVIFTNRVKGEDGQFRSVKGVQYMPMVYGLRKKILQSGDVVALEVGVVYAAEFEAGHFYYEVGKYPPLGHRPLLTLTDEQTTDDQIIGAYSIATMKDGTKSYEFMRRFEINKVRQCSQTGAVGRVYQFGPNKGKEIPPKGPWVDWFPEQAKKTVMRRHSKTLPMSGDVIIDVEGRELESGMSTAALLGSASEDAPELIEHDSQTGEIVDERPVVSTGSDEADGIDQEPDEEVDQAATESESEPETSTDESEDEALAADQRVAHEKMADSVIADIKAAKSARVAREKYLGSELERAALPEDLSAEVDAQYERHLASFKPAAPATAGAK